MKNNKITNWLLAGASCLLLGTSCDVDPTFYSQVVPDTYYTNSDAVWSPRPVDGGRNGRYVRTDPW